MQGKILQIALETNVPVTLWGAPGVGKTAQILALGEALDLPVEVVIASLHDPTDFVGLPVPDLAERKTHFLPPEWFRRLQEQERGILFLDEISTAPPAVQAAALRLVQERKLGAEALPEGVRVVLAANPPELAAGGFELTPPLANRMAHLEWAPPKVEDWVEGLLRGFPAQKPVRIRWEQELPRAKGLVAGFLSSRPHLLFQLPKDPGQLGRAWPSPRSWELATRMLAGALALDPEDRGLIALAVGSCVGAGIGAEVAAFVAEGLLDPKEALENWERVELPSRSDLLFALIGGVAALVIGSGPEELQDRWDRAWGLFGRIMAETGQKDVVLVGARPLYAFWREGENRKRISLSRSQKVLAELGAFLMQVENAA